MSPRSRQRNYQTIWPWVLLALGLVAAVALGPQARTGVYFVLAGLACWRLVILFRQILRDDPDFNGETEHRFHKHHAEGQDR